MNQKEQVNKIIKDFEEVKKSMMLWLDTARVNTEGKEIIVGNMKLTESYIKMIRAKESDAENEDVSPLFIVSIERIVDSHARSWQNLRYALSEGAMLSMVDKNRYEGGRGQ